MNIRRATTRLVNALGTLLGLAIALTSCQVVGVRFVDPHVTVTMIDQALDRWRATGVWDWPDLRWRELDELGSVPIAVMSAEDQRFWIHPGFDPEAIAKAIEWNQSHPDRPKGASTITQQVARNVFLWQNRSWFRKGLELWYTLLLELFLPKERILELYVNVAETGPATFGFEAGARHWYGRPAADLDRWEAAALVAILPKPRGWAPTAPYVESRARWIVANEAPKDRAEAWKWDRLSPKR